MPRQRKDYPEETVRARTGRTVPDLLRELYVDKRHTQEEIAAALEVSRSLVGKWLGEYGITRDDRAEIVL